MSTWDMVVIVVSLVGTHAWVGVLALIAGLVSGTIIGRLHHLEVNTGLVVPDRGGDDDEDEPWKQGQL